MKNHGSEGSATYSNQSVFETPTATISQTGKALHYLKPSMYKSMRGTRAKFYEET
jgi:hypothetical protein